jgi:hypothetical protein
VRGRSDRAIALNRYFLPAWKSLPSWYLVADVEVASNHVAMVSHPDEALERITAAVNSLAAAG